ncbi:MAG: lipid A deacylase LpxR family protein [Pseudomonadota bacterium]
MMRRRHALALACLAASGAGAASASAEDGGVVTAQFENDLFVFEEDNYTTGLQFTYVSGASHRQDWLTRWARSAGLGVPDADVRWSLGIGQLQFNPEDTETAAPLPDQHPYAAWLYLSLAALVEDAPAREGAPARLTTLQANVGVVGPSAVGEDAQNFAHSVFGIDRVNGWDNQLRDEPALQLLFERRYRFVRPVAENWQAGLEPHAAVSLGNALTYGAAGASVRIGRDLTTDFGPPRLRPGASGSTYFKPASRFNIYAFASVEARAVARNIFLDGNTFRDSLSVERKPLTGDLASGLALQWGRAQAAFTYVYRLKEFEGQREADPFGSASLQWAF